MAFTPTVGTETGRQPAASLGWKVVVPITMDSSNAYVAGGFDPTTFGYAAVSITGVVAIGFSTAALGYTVYWNTTTQKIQIYSGTTEFSGTFAASVIFTVEIIGNI